MYMKENGIEHRTVTPLWPQANGEIERQNRTLLKAMKIAYSKGQNWRKELPKFLLAYRSTPHSATGVSPAELLYNRKIRTKLPELSDNSRPQTESVRDRDAEKKELGKLYSDAKRHAAESNISVGDEVLLKQKHQNKFTTTFEPTPYEVIGKHGNQLVMQSPDKSRVVKRNITHTRPYQRPEPDAQKEKTPVSAAETAETVPMTPTVPVPVSTPQARTRHSERLHKPPEYLKDYICE